MCGQTKVEEEQFVYFFFLNNSRLEKSIPGNIQDELVSI
jgi:hypothetical protein